MFGRPAKVVAPKDTVGHEPSAYVAATALIAAPDQPVINRLGHLTGAIGGTLNGTHSGVAVRYDRGDPAVSLTGPVKSVDYAPVAAALAGVARPSTVAGVATPEFSSLAMQDPQLDPWNSLLWQRLQASK